MSTQLQALVERIGSSIKVGGKTFEVSDFAGEGDTVMAWFRSVRVRYSGMLLPRTRVAGHPACEAWNVFDGRGRTIVSFAVIGDEIKAIS